VNPSNPFSPQSLWISSGIAGGPQSTAPAPFLRKPFNVAGPIESARLTVSALGLFECHLNGKRVGNDVLAPGWTDYTKRVPCHSYDVTDLIVPGDNVLGALLGDGWYCGFVAWKGRQQYGDRPHLLAQLEITISGEESPFTILSDGSWRTAVGPIRESDILAGETYDARLELGEWASAGYDDSAWSPVRTQPQSPTIAIEPRLGPPVREIEVLTATRIFVKGEQPKGLTLLDFGQNFSGCVRIRVEAPRGTTVQLRFAEILDERDSIYTENLRSARATDYYICRGGGPEEWTPRFTFHGFRYVQVYGIAPELVLSVTGIVVHTAIEPIGTFSCSHPLLNQLQHNIVWGQKSNFLEIPTDCPQRDERLGWTGDAQVFVRTAAFNFDVRTFFNKWMRDLCDAQGPTGAVPPVAPELGFVEVPEGGPAWSDAMIICPWTIYRCYGDREILANSYASMKRYMDYMANERSANHIRSDWTIHEWQGFGDWLALDGSGRTEGATPKELIGTAFYAYDSAIMAQVARILGFADDAAHFARLRTEIEAAFQRRFMSPDGLVVSGTQTAAILALQFDLVHGDARKRMVRELVRDIERRGFHLATGFVGTPYILDVLESEGFLDVAYRLLEQETFPSWLFPIKNGATTIWERWNGWTPEDGPADKGMNSYNHYAYGAVGAWMYRFVAGIDLDPDEPGYRRIVFQPRPGGTVTWAEASLLTPHGPTRIKWELNAEKLRISITIPDGATGVLRPPPEFGPGRDLDSGEHDFELSRK
jgi:alpha-L-rhamnosidase